MNMIMDQTELKKELKQQLLAGLEEQRSFSDAELYDRIDELLFAHPELCLRDKLYLRDAVFNSFRRLDVLSEVLDNAEVTEIMINSEQEIFIERSGHMQRWERSFESRAQLEELIQSIVSRINRVVNTSTPIVDPLRLPDAGRRRLSDFARKGTLQHLHFRRHQLRKDHLFKCA